MIYPSIGQLRAFVAIANYGSFRKAAEQLHLSQPALSNQIRELEQAVSISLFHRTTRSVRLTIDGERFLIRARRALDELESGVAELHDQAAIQRGRVVTSCLPALAYTLLPRAIASLARHHPDIEVHVFDEVAPSLFRRVLSRKADFGIGPRPERDDDLMFTPILQDPFVSIFPRTHPIAAHSEVPLKYLMKFPLLTLSLGSNVRTVLDRAFAERGFTLRPTYEAFHRSILCGLVEAGLGVALLPKSIIAMMDTGGLMTAQLVEPTIVRELGIIQRKDQVSTPAANAFLVAFEQCLAGYEFVAPVTAPLRRNAPIRKAPAAASK